MRSFAVAVLVGGFPWFDGEGGPAWVAGWLGAEC